MLLLNHAAATEQGVEAAVHPEDFIYWFCCTYPGNSLEVAINYYFQDGGPRRTSWWIWLSSSATGRSNRSSCSSSHRATDAFAHLKKHAQFDLVSCDIHPEAIDFLANRIGVKTMLSAHVPEQFSPPEKYDVVFALSFFSHMPKTSFGRWIRALFDALSVPGYLVFTTHGLKSCAYFGLTPRDIPADGFWFGRTASRKTWTRQSTAPRSHSGFRDGRDLSATGASHRRLQAW